ncbi:NUDIX domain-containing protein [Haloarcula sp. S1CR25-12]|uniref:NUDIX domain-containing protein n=1 Tax=Haloarcula saliterrae TaxID=2950534 RepID=A0ABU2F701_9EURY|nr:NUDIX domain-containing protein [Haloarcula sp. S1CR25-12]MDS0257977.1 NUDIX domain-containing protein [Haloarcula sp. S1CR25-12]
MDVASRSRSRVEERLTRLEEEFGPPEVTQTTFEVGSERYQRALEKSQDGQLDVRAVVRDDDGAVLLREGDGEWMVPHGQTEPDERLSAAVKRIVRDAADVDCTVTDAVSANIHGIRNSDDEAASTVYRLSVVFTAEVVDTDEPDGDEVRWDANPDAVGEFV